MQILIGTELGKPLSDKAWAKEVKWSFHSAAFKIHKNWMQKMFLSQLNTYSDTLQHDVHKIISKSTPDHEKEDTRSNKCQPHASSPMDTECMCAAFKAFLSTTQSRPNTKWEPYKMIKGHQALPQKFNWNGQLKTFETYHQAIEAWMVQNGMQYLLREDFMATYATGRWYTARHYTGTITEEQFNYDKEILFGALMSSCKEIPSEKYKCQHEHNADGIMTWYHFLLDYGSRDSKQSIKHKIDIQLAKPYDAHYKVGALQYLDDIQSAWVHLENLDAKDALDDKQKICYITGKFACTKHSFSTVNSQKLPGRDTWDSFWKSLKDYIWVSEDITSSQPTWHINHSSQNNE